MVSSVYQRVNVFFFMYKNRIEWMDGWIDERMYELKRICVAKNTHSSIC